MDSLESSGRALVSELDPDIQSLWAVNLMSRHRTPVNLGRKEVLEKLLRTDGGLSLLNKPNEYLEQLCKSVRFQVAYVRP